MVCIWKTCTNVLTGKQEKFCSRKCGIKSAVDKRRKKLKILSLDYKGNNCEICKYNKNIWALEFHHLNPNEKEFQISDGNTRSWEEIKLELDKCILVCANCHREAHNPL